MISKHQPTTASECHLENAAPGTCCWTNITANRSGRAKPDNLVGHTVGAIASANLVMLENQQTVAEEK